MHAKMNQTLNTFNNDQQLKKRLVNQVLQHQKALYKKQCHQAYNEKIGKRNKSSKKTHNPEHPGASTYQINAIKNNMNKNKTYPKPYKHIPKPSNEAPSIPEQIKKYDKYVETQRREQFLKTNSQPPFIHKIPEVVDDEEVDEKEEPLSYCDVCENRVPHSEIIAYLGDMDHGCYDSQQRCQDCDDEINSEDDDDDN